MQLRDVLLLDVAPLSLGIESAGGVMEIIVRRNSIIPTEAAEFITTYTDNQPATTIRVRAAKRAECCDACILPMGHAPC